MINNKAEYVFYKFAQAVAAKSVAQSTNKLMTGLSDSKNIVSGIDAAPKSLQNIPRTGGNLLNLPKSTPTPNVSAPDSTRVAMPPNNFKGNNIKLIQ